MKRTMYAECEDDCFMIEGTDKNEIVEMLKMHVKNKHGMKLSNTEAEEKIMEC